MQRFKLIKRFKNNGWYLKRHGGNHDVWTNGKETEIIPRHPQINEYLARHLIEKHNL